MGMLGADSNSNNIVWNNRQEGELLHNNRACSRASTYKEYFVLQLGGGGWAMWPAAQGAHGSNLPHTEMLMRQRKCPAVPRQAHLARLEALRKYVLVGLEGAGPGYTTDSQKVRRKHQPAVACRAQLARLDALRERMEAMGLGCTDDGGGEPELPLRAPASSAKPSSGCARHSGLL